MHSTGEWNMNGFVEKPIFEVVYRSLEQNTGKPFECFMNPIEKRKDFSRPC